MNWLCEDPKNRPKNNILLMVIISSREDIPAYQRVKNSVRHLIRTGQCNSKPDVDLSESIQVIFTKDMMEFRDAAFAVSDHALITPTRDGMNLVAYEYIAVQNLAAVKEARSGFKGAGQLILSNTVGAAGYMEDG